MTPTTTTAGHAHLACKVRIARLVVNVVDGDTLRRVAGARVRLLHRKATTNHRGIAVFRGPKRRLTVAVSARRYTAAHVRLNFHRRMQTVRIYQPRLQWPLYGATLQRTQAQPNIRIRPPFRLVWSRSVGSLIEFPAVVWNGQAYIGDLRATIRAVSMRSGKLSWLHRTPGGARMASSPAIYGRELIYHTISGRIYALRLSDGSLIWSWNSGSRIESSPLIKDGIDYFGTVGGRVEALDLHTRRLRWNHSLGAKVTSSAALAGSRLFIGDYAGRLWALNPRNGRTRWVGRVNGRIYGTPAVSRDRVFVPSSTGHSLTAFSVSGRYLWRVTTGSYVYSSPAVWGGRVFFGSWDGWFYGVSASTGRIVWRVYAGRPISGAAVAVAGVAYAGTFGHRILGVDVRSGRVILRFPHGEFVPVSGNGGRLLLHGHSRLYAVEPRRKHRHRHAKPQHHRKHDVQSGC
ncbi:MAG: hypothetical protein QOG85_1265 [Gaiellaceae bacterium]|nr:hypothetical protein [Gaiellaceae bacterium]